MTEKKTAEEIEFEQIKFEIAKIQFNKLSFGNGYVEANPATHEIALWVQSLLVKQREAFAAQQSKMPTREECDKKMFEILSQPTSLGKDLRGVRSPAMMMAEYSEWLRNQIG